MSNKKKRKPQNHQPRPQKAEAIDFDALRAKRHRDTRQIPPIKIGGKNRHLRETIPLSVTDYFAENTKREKTGDNEQRLVVLISDMQRILAALFGEEQWAEISQHIDIGDVPPLFDKVFEAYGESPGESSNSGQS